MLKPGQHETPDQGVNILERVSQLAGQPFTDWPENVSPVLADLLRGVCDDCREPFRQQLEQYAQPLLHTFENWSVSGGREEERAWIVADWLVRAQLYIWAETVSQTSIVKGIKSLEPVTFTNEKRTVAAILTWTAGLVHDDSLDSWVETDFPGMLDKVRKEVTLVECQSLYWAAGSYGITQSIQNMDRRVAHLRITQSVHSLIRSLIRLAVRRAIPTAPAIERIENSLTKVVSKCLIK